MTTTRTETLFDASYTGPRFRYALVNRPLDIATAPGDFIIFSNRPHPKFCHGTIDYPRCLTEAEVAAYELKPVPTGSR